MPSLLLIPLDDTVVFPTMDVTLPVDTGDEQRVLLVPRHDGEYAAVGTIAEVSDRVRLPGGGRGLATLARRLGYVGADAGARLLADYRRHTEQVRATYARLLGLLPGESAS